MGVNIYAIGAKKSTLGFCTLYLQFHSINRCPKSRWSLEASHPDQKYVNKLTLPDEVNKTQLSRRAYVQFFTFQLALVCGTRFAWL